MRCQNFVKLRILLVKMNRPMPRFECRALCENEALRAGGAARLYSAEAACLVKARASRWVARSGRACRSPLGRGALPTIAACQACIRSDPFWLLLQLRKLILCGSRSSRKLFLRLGRFTMLAVRGLMAPFRRRQSPFTLGWPAHREARASLASETWMRCRDPYTLLYSALGRQTCCQCCVEPHVRQRSDRDDVPVADVEMHLRNLRSSPGAH